MKPILEIQNISKKFRIGANQSKYLTLSEKMGSIFKKRDKEETEIWALKDISFDVFPGDTIGIIGKNGAGKSTLLKVLSRITPPTVGKIICRGRIASLLEVGTGFHGELTGRENIYLNGSILGLKKTEINKKFEEIVDFSGVEKFLDTQLKHYSSGMQLRLAFAVAAHLEPEILIIDEVLAVGDAEFQKKCLGKMDEISKEHGRTILFVSHNMSAVKALCSKSILLEKGSIFYQGSSNEAISLYMIKKESNYKDKIQENKPCILKAWLSNASNESNVFINGEKIIVNLNIYNPQKKALDIALAFFDNLDQKLWNFSTEMHGLSMLPEQENINIEIACCPPNVNVSDIYIDVEISCRTAGDYRFHKRNFLSYSIVNNKDTFFNTDSILLVKCELTYKK